MSLKVRKFARLVQIRPLETFLPARRRLIPCADALTSTLEGRYMFSLRVPALNCLLTTLATFFRFDRLTQGQHTFHSVRPPFCCGEVRMWHLNMRVHAT